MTTNENTLWQQTVSFHGHSCPGLALGFRIAQAYLNHINVPDISQFVDEELTCIAETDACGLDAIQFVLACTSGKGNLLLKLRGKNAFNFYNRKNNTSCRILWVGEAEQNLSREDKIDFFLNGDSRKLYKIMPARYPFPREALISKSEHCTACDELTAEPMLRLHKGKLYCLDCFADPSRILE